MSMSLLEGSLSTSSLSTNLHIDIGYPQVSDDAHSWIVEWRISCNYDSLDWLHPANQHNTNTLALTRNSDPDLHDLEKEKRQDSN